MTLVLFGPDGSGSGAPLLAIIQEVCGRMGQPQPTTVVGSSDAQVKQLLALANKAGHDLAQAYNWTALIEEQTFVTTNAEAQSGVMQSDFDRFVPNSFYNRTTMRPLEGPITPIQWQALKAMPALNSVYLMFRQRQGQFLIVPAPPAGQTIAFEYVSSKWAKSAGGTPQTTFLADTDTTYLDESLIADAVVWMFLRSKGMSYAEEMQTYVRNLDQAMGRDGPSSQLGLAPRPINLSRINLPDGGFGA